MLARVLGWRKHPTDPNIIIISMRFITYIMKDGDNYIGFPRYYSGIEEMGARKDQISVEPNDVLIILPVENGMIMSVANDLQIAYEMLRGFEE